MEDEFKNYLHMTGTEREQLLTKLDAATKNVHDQGARREERLTYRATDVPVIVRHPGGSIVRFLVCTRNLSSGGVGFLHGGFLHQDTDCVVKLNGDKDTSVSMAGHIVHCRHIIGRHHEIGVRFVEKLDTELILGSNRSKQAIDENDNSDMPSLSGNVLLVDYAEWDRKLLESQLRAGGLEVKTVVSPGLALDALKRSEFDLVICDPALEPTDSTPLIQRMRDQGFTKPILLLTAETHPSHLKILGAESASDRISKPYCIENLFLVVGRWLGQPVPQTAIYSTFEDRPDVAKLLPDYLKQINRLKQELDKAIKSDSLEAARKICRYIQGSGSIYGFEPVTVAAIDAVRELDRSQSVSESSDQLRLLVDICNCLKISCSVDIGSESKRSTKKVA